MVNTMAQPGGTLIVSTRPNGVLFIMVGPAGAGKNTIMKRIIECNLPVRQMPTVTTRAMRPGEQEGREHFFVSIDKFNEMLAENALIEHQEVYPGSFYGTPRQQLYDLLNSGEKMIADIEVVGAFELKEAFPDNVVLIFIAPPSLEELERRIRERGNVSEEELGKRLKRAEWELSFRHRCDYQVVNDDFDLAVEEVTEIISNELERIETR
jgi:guanylate kinase